MGRRPGGDGRGARAPRRADRRRGRGARRQLHQVDGRGRRDRLGVRLGRRRASRPRSPPTGRWPPRRGRPASRSPSAGASTPARRSGATATTSARRVNLAARAARAGRRRPDLPVRGDRRARRRAPARRLLARRPRPAPPQGRRRAGAHPRARRARASTRRRPRPSARTAACSRSRPTTARFFFGREAVVADLVGRARARPAARRRRRVGQRQVLGAARRRRRRRARRRGRRASSDAARARRPAPSPRSTSPDEPDRLVVVDQFEELFTLCDDADRRRAFIDALLRAALRRRDRRARRLLRPARARTPSSRAPSPPTRCCSGPMTDAELERAVTEPARLAGLRARARPGRARSCATSPASRARCRCSRTRCARPGSGATAARSRSRATARAAASPRRSRRTADAVVDALPDEQRRLARSVFLRLTELGEGIEDTRRRVAIDELVPEGAARDAVDALLERLAEARLVTLDEGTAEVAHEALIREWPRLRRWLDEDRAGIRLHRQLSDAARLWEAGGREPSDLYRGARLAGASSSSWRGRAQRDRARVPRRERRRGRARAARRAAGQPPAARPARRRRASCSSWRSPAACSASASATTRARPQSAAEAQALTSDAERVGALALTAPTLDQSMLLRRRRRSSSRTASETRGDLLAVLQQQPGGDPHPAAVGRPASWRLAISPDGRLLASGDDAGVVRFTDLRTWKPRGAPVKLPQPVAAQAMRFSPDGRTLAVGTRTGQPRGALPRRRRASRPAPDRLVAQGSAKRPRPLRRSPTRPTAAGSPSAWRRIVADGPHTGAADRLLLVDAHSGRTRRGGAATRRPGQMGGARRASRPTAR